MNFFVFCLVHIPLVWYFTWWWTNWKRLTIFGTWQFLGCGINNGRGNVGDGWHRWSQLERWRGQFEWRSTSRGWISWWYRANRGNGWHSWNLRGKKITFISIWVPFFLLFWHDLTIIIITPFLTWLLILMTFVRKSFGLQLKFPWEPSTEVWADEEGWLSIITIGWKKSNRWFFWLLDFWC